MRSPALRRVPLTAKSREIQVATLRGLPKTALPVPLVSFASLPSISRCIVKRSRNHEGETLKLSQILESMPGWRSSMRTATGPHKGRLTVVSMVLPRRAKDYLANRAPLAVAPFKASKTERERIAIDLFEVLERGSVWEIDGVRSLADWDEGPGRTARVVVWGRGTIDLGRCLLAIDVENGEVLVFDEDAFVPDPDGWTR